MWKSLIILVHAKDAKATTFGAVNGRDHWVERSFTLAAVNSIAQDVSAQETPVDEESGDNNEGEEPAESIYLIRFSQDPSSQNRRIYLGLLLATTLALCLAASVILLQGHSLGLTPIAATWTGFGIFMAAIAVLLVGLLRLLPRRLRPPGPQRSRRRLALDRAEHVSRVDAKLYIVTNIVAILVFIIGFFVITTGAVIVIVANGNSTGVTISVVGGAATALTIYYRATLKPYHQVVAQRYSDPAANPETKAPKSTKKVAK